jgi:hypothetical protein
MTDDQFSNLKTLDLAGLQRVFGEELADHQQDARRELAGDRAFRRTPSKRTLIDARQTANAVAHIGRLPAPGESIHLVCAGGYSLYHHIEAVLQIAAPATIRYLGICTLGFSKDNLERLIGLLDAGTIGQVDFLYSVYFKSNEREICERLAHELTTRGQRVLSMRTHAKLLLIELGDGRDCYTIESSANLRSCKNVEQSTFTNDRSLLDFHRQWLNELFTEGAQNVR